jgi:N-acyl-phosphatidylethanolamine-hydrolysing phospholipase D
MTKKIVWFIVFSSIATLMVVGACATKNPHYQASKSHHTPEGFRNLYAEKHPGGFWKWKRDQWREGLPKKPAGGYQFPLQRPNIDYLKANRSDATMTWIGHATLLLQMKGVNILTDPHFSERASPVDFAGPKRVVAAAMSIEELPPIDIVVISHNHYDHLDAASVIKLDRRAQGKTQFLVPLGLKAWFDARKIENVIEMDWWDDKQANGLKVSFTPMQHWSKRTLTDTNQALWGGWLFSSDNYKFLFLADTGYSKDFQDIFERHGAVDLAAIPIGHYEPRWFMKIQHANPEESVRIMQDLHARQAVGVHWGTFDDLTDESLYDPPKALASALDAAQVPREKFWVLQHGETKNLDHGRRASNP